MLRIVASFLAELNKSTCLTAEEQSVCQLSLVIMTIATAFSVLFGIVRKI